jgi:PAS domain S-box-containing protein
MLGFKREELLQRNIRDIIDHEDLPASLAQLEALVRDGPDVQADKHYLHKNGTQLEVHERVAAIRDAAGKITSLLFVSFAPPTPRQ